MSEDEKPTTVDGNDSTPVESQETAGPSARPAVAGPGRDDSHHEDVSSVHNNDVADALETGNVKLETAAGGPPPSSVITSWRAGATAGIRPCATARRIPYRFELPALDDLFAVQVAVEHVARALAAGLMKREDATGLLYALQQSSVNHRKLLEARMSAGAMNPTLSPNDGEKAGAPALETGNWKLETVVEQQRLVEEYPEFEEEFGLSQDIDVSKPAHVVFLPPEDCWRVPTPARDPKTSPWVHAQPTKHWTKEDIELEELQKNKEKMGRSIFAEQHFKLTQRITGQAEIAYRKHLEAAWQTEADRRNAALEEQERQYAGMSHGERQAYQLGVVRGLQAAQEQAEEEERKKPQQAKAAVGSQ